VLDGDGRELKELKASHNTPKSTQDLFHDAIHDFGAPHCRLFFLQFRCHARPHHCHYVFYRRASLPPTRFFQSKGGIFRNNTVNFTNLIKAVVTGQPAVTCEVFFGDFL
jgi:hypothetical protein